MSAPLGPLTTAALTAVCALVLFAVVCWHAWQYRRDERARVAAELVALLDQAAVDRTVTGDFEEPTR